MLSYGEGSRAPETTTSGAGRQNNLQRLTLMRFFVEVARGFVASCDWPSSAFWRERLQQYPDAEVVLTFRDPEMVVQVLLRHDFCHANPKSPHSNLGIRTFCYLAAGSRDPSLQKKLSSSILSEVLGGKTVIAASIAHVEDVKATCPKDRLTRASSKRWLGAPLRFPCSESRAKRPLSVCQ
jgi:hypothetical protein